MTQDILDKLHTALYSVSPLASERERIIGEIGETVWVESLEKMLMALPEEARKEVVDFLNGEDLEKAVSILITHNIDIDAILAEVSKSVLDDIITNK